MHDTPKPQRVLLTRDQVVDALRAEVAANGLSNTARKYTLSPQQVSDVCRGRATLTRRMWTLLRFRLHEFFERIGDA